MEPPIWKRSMEGKVLLAEKSLMRKHKLGIMRDFCGTKGNVRK